MAGQRGQLSAVGALVERVDDHGQGGLVAEPVEQRLECSDVVHGLRDVRPLVRTEPVGERRVVAPPRAGVELEHETVVEAHRRHLGEHLAPEELGVGGLGRPLPDPGEQGLGVARWEVGGRRRGMAVVGCGGPRGDECLAPSPERSEVARPGRGVLAGEVGEPIEVGVEVRPIRVDDVVGPERGHHATGPAAVAEPGVGLQLVESRRRSWPGTRSRTARRGRGGGRRRRRAGRRGGRRSRRRCRPPAASRPRRPPTSVWSSHSFEGVPRKRWMCSPKVRQTRRPSDSAGEPSRGETPSASRGTPWL